MPSGTRSGLIKEIGGELSVVGALLGHIDGFPWKNQGLNLADLPGQEEAETGTDRDTREKISPAADGAGPGVVAFRGIVKRDPHEFGKGDPGLTPGGEGMEIVA
ncbi:MAG: hypothetical protein ABL994_16595 [Verrucomicrobiales bacterium]